jgi:predicted transposase/invertase (TIGR01784 family)
MRYLDPKNDLTFKKVFGEHPHILKSFLNAVMPLEEGKKIVSLEYLPAELVPEIPMFANSIVDVRCVDEKGQQFIVEMQMIWTDSFKSRVLFNASKAYIKQVGHGFQYKGLQPVYSLNIINENFDDKPDIFIHHYQIIHTQDSNDVMEGLEFVFIELPKFKAKKFTDKKLQVLWLRFLSEINDLQEGISPDFLDVPELREASELILESGLTKGELETYDRYWDHISTEKSLKADSYDKGMEQGIKQGIEQGIKQRIEQEKINSDQKIKEEKLAIAIQAKKMGLSVSDISKLTGLSEQVIESIE